MKGKPTSFAKITCPKVSRLLSRSRLFRLLDKARQQRSVIWLAAPPGAGKTSLVASYLQTHSARHIWYQVDAGDEDVGSFFHYMGQAAQKICSRSDKPLPQFSPEYLFSLPTFTRHYFRELFSRLESSSVVVFDNFQEAVTASIFTETIANGLVELPEGITAIIISRELPPPSYARMRAGSAIEVIDWDTLRLNAEETQEMVKLLKQDKHEHLSAEGLQQLCEETRGWAAGVVLLMERARTHVGEVTTPNTHIPQEVFDYFANEIFDRMASEHQVVLLKTALLPRMTAAMAVALTGLEQAEQILDDLNRHHYFLDKRVSDLQAVYQYHPLFKEFLLSQGKTRLTSQTRGDVQSRAVKLLMEAGQEEGAVNILQEVEGWDLLSELILKQAQSLVNTGRSKTLIRWMSKFPQQVLDSTPWLVFWSGVSRMTINITESRVLFERPTNNLRSNVTLLEF